MPVDNPPAHSITIQLNFLQALEAEEHTPEQPADGAPAWPPSRQHAIEAYHQGIDSLYQVLDSDGHAHDQVRGKLQQFGKFVADGIKDGFQDDMREQFMTQVQLDFKLFCTLVQKTNLPQDARRQAILNLTEGVGVCAPGVAQHIETSTRELKALTGLGHNFAHRLTHAIEYQIQDFMRQQKVCKHAGNEIHYVAAFFNQVAERFGLPQRTDVLIPKDLAQAVLDAGAQQVLDAAPVDHVIAQMAQDYLAHIEDFHAASQHHARANSLDLQTFDTLYQKFQRELKPRLDSMFGPVDNGIFFHSSSSEDERYWLTSDITLVARAIARNLRDSDVIAFKPAYVTGAPGEGLKLKQLGEQLFYVSETRKGALADPQPPHIHQYQTLDRLVLEDMERGRKLLDQLAVASASQPAARTAQAEFWKKMPAGLYREMKDAPGPEEAARIFSQTMALLHSSLAKNAFALETLEQARLGEQPEIGRLIFEQLNARQLGVDDTHCREALRLALKLGNAGFAKELIKATKPGMLSAQDNEGYTLLMHALECDQTEAAGLLIQIMAPEQLSLQEADGNTALGGALIKGQAGLADAIIEKLNGQQLNLQNANGYTALMLALLHGQTEGAKGIIDKSGRKQLLLRNLDGDTARDMALRGGEAEIAQVLKEKSSRWLSWLYRR